MVLAVITSFDICPNYFSGHTFTWEVSAKLAAAPPWVFHLERSVADGPWARLSPDLDTLFAWQAPRQPVRNANDLDEWYRLVMDSRSGKFTSSPIGSYGVLSRWDWLQAREVVRRFTLQARKKAGVPTLLWRKMTTGAKCRACVDEASGVSVDPDCKVCMGTRFVGGYHGPYASWSVFSRRKSDKSFDPSEGGVAGATDVAQHQIKTLCQPPLRKNDILVDANSSKRYIVHTVESIFELRRLPVLQSVMASEASLDGVLQRLGGGEWSGDARDYGPGGRLSVFVEGPTASARDGRRADGPDSPIVCESIEYI
jgi:hypothetical protein